MNAVLQRTKKGRNEVLRKSHELTQSERLLLALADGKTSANGLRQKVRGMADRRFRLVLADLTAKGFLETAYEGMDKQIENVDPVALAQFVRQDPLDPVSITSLQIHSSAHADKGGATSSREESNLHQVSDEQGDEGAQQESVKSVDFYLPLEEPVSEQRDKPVTATTYAQAVLVFDSDDEGEEGALQRRLKREKRARQIQVGYWLMFVGLVCLVLFIAAIAMR